MALSSPNVISRSPTHLIPPLAVMAEVIDLSDDDDDPLLNQQVSACGELNDALQALGIADVSVLERAVAEAVESHFNTAEIRVEIATIAKSQQCLSEMISDLLQSSAQIKADCKRLGNPLSIESHCDGPDDVTTWDAENDCLVVPNPVRIISYDASTGIVPEVIEEEDDFIDSGGESDGSDIALLEPVQSVASKVKLPPAGELMEYKIAKGDAVLFMETVASMLSCWLPGKINQMYEREGVDHYAITFNTSTGSSNCIRTQDCVVAFKTQVNRFRVKQRVVAYYRYRPDLTSRPLRLMAGFVAESLLDKSEYLIFFDNGKAGYVPHDECFYFNSPADAVIQRISVDSSYYGTFLTKYFENYPERLMLKPPRNKPIVFLHENKMTMGTVREQYHHLIKIVLKNRDPKSREIDSQWLYSGSWMLRDIFLTLFPNDDFSMKGPISAVQRRKRATHKLSIVPPLRGYTKKRDKDKKAQKKGKTSLQSGRVPAARVTFSNAEGGGSDSDFTDCSSQSTEIESEIRRKKFVKKKSPEYEHRMILQRRVEEAAKIAFPVRAPCFPDSVQKRLVDVTDFCYLPHECSTACLPMARRKEAEAVNHMLGRENPFAIPLILGWRREVRSHEFICLTKTESERDVYYRSPCGKSISSAEEAHFYLSRTRSAIPVDLFAFDPDLEVYCRQKDVGCFHYKPDISDGVEDSPIPLVNQIDESEPDPFVYRKVFTLSDDTRYDKIATKESYDPENEAPFDQDFMSCCSCDDNCEDAMRCECQSLTRENGRIVYPVHDDNYSGYAYRRLNQVIHGGVFECHARCPCDNSCLNRLVQLRNRNRLQIFKTGHDKGWGIRTLHDIPKGTFLCQYVARILTPEQGNDGDHDDTYFADLDHIKQLEANKRYHKEHPEDFIEEDDDPEEILRLKREMIQGIKWLSIMEKFDEGGTYVVDAIQEGNIGRFFNHSCEPNCDVQNVFLHTHDPRFPCICLFTIRTVKAMEELCWDYCYEVDSIPGRKMFCRCGSRKCRKRLL